MDWWGAGGPSRVPQRGAAAGTAMTGSAHLVVTACWCLIKKGSGEFPGIPVVRTQHSHCQGPGFNPYLGDLTPHKPRSAAKKRIQERPFKGSSFGWQTRELPTPTQRGLRINLQRMAVTFSVHVILGKLPEPLLLHLKAHRVVARTKWDDPCRPGLSP